MFERWSSYWKERYTGVKESALSLAARAQNSYIVTHLTAFGLEIYNNRNVRNFAQGLLDPYWHLPEAMIAIRDNPNVRQVFKQTFYSCSKILVASFTYYKGIRPLLMLCADEDSNVIQASDNLVYFYVVAQVPRLIVEDAVNSVSLAHTFNEIMPKKAAHFECTCDALEKRRGNFNTNIHYVTHRILLLGVSSMQPVGGAIKIVLNAWFIGQSNLDYRLNMCDPHRYRQISVNNFYLIGNGVGIQLFSEIICYLIGVDRTLSALAIQTLAMKVGMLTTVLRTEPLPGNETSRDVSFYMRHAAELFVQNRVIDLKNYLRKKNREQWLLDHPQEPVVTDKNKTSVAKTDVPPTPANEQKGVVASQPLAKSEKAISENIFKFVKADFSKWLGRVLGNEYAHLRTFVRTGPMRLLIELKKDQIKDALDGVHGIRSYPVLFNAVVKVSKWVPKNLMPADNVVTTEDLRMIRSVVFLNVMRQVLPLVADLVGHALRDPQLIAESESLELLNLGMEDAINKINPLDNYVDTASQQPPEEKQPEDIHKAQEIIPVASSIPGDLLTESTLLPVSTTLPSLSQSTIVLYSPRKVPVAPPVIDAKASELPETISNSIITVQTDYYAKLSQREPMVTQRKPKTPLQQHGQFSQSVNRMVNKGAGLFSKLGKELGLGK